MTLKELLIKHKVEWDLNSLTEQQLNLPIPPQEGMQIFIDDLKVRQQKKVLEYLGIKNSDKMGYTPIATLEKSTWQNFR